MVMELKDAEKHWQSWKERKEGWTPERVWGKEVCEVVEGRREEVRQWRDAVM